MHGPASSDHMLLKFSLAARNVKDLAHRLVNAILFNTVLIQYESHFVHSIAMIVFAVIHVDSTCKFNLFA